MKGPDRFSGQSISQSIPPPPVSAHLHQQEPECIVETPCIVIEGSQVGGGENGRLVEMRVTRGVGGGGGGGGGIILSAYDRRRSPSSGQHHQTAASR